MTEQRGVRRGRRDDAYFDGFRGWLLDDLPGINKDLLHGTGSPTPLLTAVRDFVARAPRVEDLDVPRQRSLLSYLGFALGSLERHRQDQGDPPGAALHEVPGAEELLVQLGRCLGHPPRDSFHTYATWNDHDRITFTGTGQEHLFLDVNIEVARSVTEVRDAVRPVVERPRPWEVPQTAADLAEAQAAVVDVRQQFHRFLPATEHFDPAFFLDELRQYFCRWEIAGEVWAGPSAARLVPQMQCDYLLGLGSAGYTEHVAHRMRYFTEAECRELNADLTIRTSLLGLVAVALGLSGTAEPLAGSEATAAALRRSTDSVVRFVSAAHAVVWAWATASALHWSVVQNVLVKPQSDRSAPAAGATPVDNASGTSGMSLAEIKGVMEMRRFDPRLVALHSALRDTK
jgi:hypothetical protein